MQIMSVRKYVLIIGYGMCGYNCDKMFDYGLDSHPLLELWLW